MHFFTLLAVVACVVGASTADPAGRLIGGEEPEALGLFSHHVVISSARANHKCGGSILNANWVLTSAACVKRRSLLNLYFGKTHIKSTIGNFLDVTVKHDQVEVFDSLALIRLENPIQFSDTVAPVAISHSSVDGLSSRFAVMPGFTEEKLSSISGGDLRYGTFMIQEVAECRRAMDGENEFRDGTRLCTRGWGGNGDVPCESDVGSGLIVGWPSRSELVGVFEQSKCDPSSPAVFIHLAKYVKWIETTIAH